MSNSTLTVFSSLLHFGLYALYIYCCLLCVILLMVVDYSLDNQMYNSHPRIYLDTRRIVC